MENVNEMNEAKLNVASNPNKRLALKSIAIGIIALLLLIPIKMVEGLIEEREYTAKQALKEVFNQWGGEQLIIAPNISYDLKIKYYDSNEKKTEYIKRPVKILPESLKINGNVTSKQLKRGIYEIVTYDAPIEISGYFLITNNMLGSEMVNQQVNIAISDIKGISKEVKLTLGEKEYTMIPNGESYLSTKRLSAGIDMSQWKVGEQVPFKMVLKLNGSQSLKFLPIGKETKVSLTSNCQTPSFCGNFLPETRDVRDDGFSSEWNVSYINRSYPQVIVGAVDTNVTNAFEDSVFGVNLLIPVQHYQKTLRCVKYAELFVLLTFVLFFFIEIVQKKKVHPLQYTLVGLALTLFYSLLLSISEHLGFVPAYMIASVMTIALITLFTYGVLKIRKTAAYVGVALTGLYTYIFVLIRMETYALLAGSLGLFVILAVLMYISQRINWSKAE